MSELQSVLSDLRQNDMRTTDLLNATIDAWEAVVAENESEKELVAPEYWDAWLTHRGLGEKIIRDACDDFRETDTLTPSNIKALNSLLDNIIHAKHMPREVLASESAKKAGALE